MIGKEEGGQIYLYKSRYNDRLHRVIWKHATPTKNKGETGIEIKWGLGQVMS